jgi:hypothetical protein
MTHRPHADPIRALLGVLAVTALSLAIAQGELVVVGAYAPYVGPADVHTPIELPFPRVLGGQEPYVFELTAGALPRPFATRAVGEGAGALHPGGTYVILLGSDGALRGTTGWPGRFTGTVTVTDANGRTGQADFELDLALALAYVGEPEVRVPEEPAVVVHGDRVRVSGVPVPALPEVGMDLYFDLTLDAAASRGTPARPPEPGDFDIHRAHGTISKMRPSPGSDALRWVYQVVAHRAERVDGALVPLEAGPSSAPVTLTFIRP